MLGPGLQHQLPPSLSPCATNLNLKVALLRDERLRAEKNVWALKGELEALSARRDDAARRDRQREREEGALSARREALAAAASREEERAGLAKAAKEKLQEEVRRARTIAVTVEVVKAVGVAVPRAWSCVCRDPQGSFSRLGEGGGNRGVTLDRGERGGGNGIGGIGGSGGCRGGGNGGGCGCGCSPRGPGACIFRHAPGLCSGAGGVGSGFDRGKGGRSA